MNISDEEEKNDKLEQIYNKYKQRIFYWAYNIVKDNYKAEDIVHNVFLKLSQKNIMAHIKDVDDPDTSKYLAVTTRNLAINLYIKEKKEKTLSFADLDDRYALSMRDDIEKAIDEVSLEELMKSVRGVSERYGDILILKYVYQYEDKEIAKFLNKKEVTIRKWIQRGKDQVRKNLKKNQSGTTPKNKGED